MKSWSARQHGPIPTGIGLLLLLLGMVVPVAGCGEVHRRSWKTYSNGWYGYAFAYPPTATLSYGGKLVISETVMDHVVRVNQGGRSICQVSVSLGKPEALLKAVGSVELKRPVRFHGVTWEKATYTVHKGSAFSEATGTVWVTSQEPFTYTLSAVKGQEPVCGAILSTFTFRIDPSVPSAAEAAAVKQAALAYAQAHMPGNIFIGGVFVEPGRQSGARESMTPEAMFRVTPRAVVEFAARNQGYKGRTAISLEKRDGTWTVVGRAEPRPRLSRWSWLNDVL